MALMQQLLVVDHRWASSVQSFLPLGIATAHLISAIYHNLHRHFQPDTHTSKGMRFPLEKGMILER